MHSDVGFIYHSKPTSKIKSVCVSMRVFVTIGVETTNCIFQNWHAMPKII